MLQPLLQLAFCAFLLQISYNWSYMLVEDPDLPFEQFYILGHTLWHQLLVFKKYALFTFLHVFVTFVCFFMISIISYIGSLSWTFRASDRSPNQFISTSSCVPAAQRYCLHQLQGSLKHINPGTSNMATASDLTLYSSRPHVSVILSKTAKPGVKCFIFLSS